MVNSSASFWRSVSLLLTVLVIAQWILFTVLLDAQQSSTSSSSSSSSSSPSNRAPQLAEHQHQHQHQQKDQQAFHPALSLPKSASASALIVELKQVQDGTLQTHQQQHQQQYEGVAVTVMMRAPKWFHRRYTVMLHNVLANLPQGWILQVFSNEDWLGKDVLPLHPGLQQIRLFKQEQYSRVIWTPLPANMTKRSFKPKQLLKSTWFWEHVLAENVFMFSGNGAVCANAHVALQDFVDHDYVGTPWRQHYGMGGDGGTHSFRHRSAMLRLLKDDPPPPDDHNSDYAYFVKAILAANNNQNKKDPAQSHSQSLLRYYNIANRTTTLRFGGAENADSKIPLVLSGIQASLNWTTREGLLHVCPELKTIFPSMHEPACFGAHPDGPTCKTTICALRDTLPAGGC